MWNQYNTGPCAAVQLDSHAGRLGMDAVRYKANTSCDDRRIKFTQLGDVCVHVALKHLQTTWPWRHHSHQHVKRWLTTCSQIQKGFGVWGNVIGWNVLIFFRDMNSLIMQVPMVCLCSKNQLNPFYAVLSVTTKMWRTDGRTAGNAAR